MKTLNPKLVHIGMIRYADHYHPTNEDSERKLRALLDEANMHIGSSALSDVRVARANRKLFAKIASDHGYKMHFFEKGLGR